MCCSGCDVVIIGVFCCKWCAMPCQTHAHIIVFICKLQFLFVFMCVTSQRAVSQQQRWNLLKSYYVFFWLSIEALWKLCRIFHPLQHCATVSVSHSFYRCILVPLFPFLQFQPMHFDCAVVSCLAFSVDPQGLVCFKTRYTRFLNKCY